MLRSQFKNIEENQVIRNAEEVQDYLNDLSRSLPLFQHIRETVITSELIATVNHLKQFSDVIILGTGGSSLGGQTLCDLSDSSDCRLHFHDNIDPHTFTGLFQKLDLKNTAVLAISKSGSTAETLMQLLFCLQQFKDESLPIPHHFRVITEPKISTKENPMRMLAESLGIECLDHHTGIGGRFAVFSNVGLLPALLVGLDAEKILEGARLVMESIFVEGRVSSFVEDVCLIYNLMEKGITQSIMFPYVDRLRNFSFWYRQLWAESLGKNGKGTTPVASFGTVDQHSQLQLYLDGPKDKFFTVVTLENLSSDQLGNHPIKETLDCLSLYRGKSLGDVLCAEQKATIDTLKNNGCPVRHIELTEINEQSLGALMMRFILETLAMSKLLNVDPFSQPAVEEGKILTRQYLLNS